ncbi:MAG TPA: 30S ribosomal protein S12 methylthiotransferase RimO [Proteobacteria bacterium]|nr:30S ribosomal protein S12 methylthiotransferase RimO [Pseudomonadota bacterium]
MMQKVAIINLGCPKNEVDAEKMAYLLNKNDFTLLDNPAEAEIIIVNTCAFIQPAIEEAIETILDLAYFKKKGCCRLLVVCGCLPQRYGMELADEIPEIDLLLGTDGFAEIVSAIRSYPDKPNQFGCHGRIGVPDYRSLHEIPQLTTHAGFSYLKIAEGCDNRCSYCMIPAIKGHQQSAPLQTLLKQAGQMIANGIREINLVAQDITAYGLDFSCTPQLTVLLRKLSSLPGLERIRLLYAYPHRISSELINLIAEENKICKYLDLPVQHISDSILKAMGRQDCAADILRTVTSLKSEILGLYLRSTVIVGFPGETNDDFRQLVDFVKQGFFDYLGAFTYWAEEGSRAANFPGQIADPLKEERLQLLMEEQRKITEQRLRNEVGSIKKVLIEGLSRESDLLLQGRTSFQAPEIDGITYITEGEAEPGNLVDVEIYDSFDFDLFARIRD